MSGVVVGTGDGDTDLDLDLDLERDPPEKLDLGILTGAVTEGVVEAVTIGCTRNSSNLPFIKPTALTASISPL